MKRLSREDSAAGAIDAFGVGGPKLQAEGLRVVVDARELLAMGFTEILGRLPRILRAMRELKQAAIRERPDVAVVIDYPDFHFRLAKLLRPLGFPIAYYIPPKVWVWRKGRLRILRERFARVLNILPFEEDFYRREGVPARYVGNPLVDELPLSTSREEARRELSVPDDARVLLLMPGSRPSELARHLVLMLDAAQAAAPKIVGKGGERLIVLLPFPLTADFPEMLRRIEDWKARSTESARWLDIRPSQGDAPRAMLAADAGLIKSGTSTLEAGILGCVHAVIYRASWLSDFVFHRIIRRTFKGPVGLVNLVHGWQEGEPWLVPEYIERGMTADQLRAEIVSLFLDERKRARIRAGLDLLREKMKVDVSPSELAAREILALVKEPHARAGN